MANAAQDINFFSFLPFSKNFFLIESAFTKKSNLKEKISFTTSKQ
jgi:hypothetical protein